ncbi:MAG: hypothetical protein NZO58_12185, partial [Gemmataceae bacterium]|nr:hypothetical protein [Gemmataceae bacterium]
ILSSDQLAHEPTAPAADFAHGSTEQENQLPKPHDPGLPLPNLTIRPCSSLGSVPHQTTDR